jgi:ABC-type Zn2+ transport system substrate-binding protein/surface adhesin
MKQFNLKDAIILSKEAIIHARSIYAVNSFEVDQRMMMMMIVYYDDNHDDDDIDDEDDGDHDRDNDDNKYSDDDDMDDNDHLTTIIIIHLYFSIVPTVHKNCYFLLYSQRRLHERYM